MMLSATVCDVVLVPHVAAILHMAIFVNKQPSAVTVQQTLLLDCGRHEADNTHYVMSSINTALLTMSSVQAVITNG